MDRTDEKKFAREMVRIEINHLLKNDKEPSDIRNLRKVEITSRRFYRKMNGEYDLAATTAK